VKAIDTNILARYLRDDDVLQSARAARLMQRAVNERQPLFVNDAVLCELSWILASVYDHEKDEIIKMVDSILVADYLEVEDRDTVQTALEDYKHSKADFADCLIGRRNRALGCETTLTFDRGLRGLEAFKVF